MGESACNLFAGHERDVNEGMNNNSGNDKTMTIHDVARELGVSASTVSRAISGKGRIGATTRPDSRLHRRTWLFSQCGSTEPGTIQDQ